MIDEGYIKFKAHHEFSTNIIEEVVAPLIKARQYLVKHDLIGMYDNGIGYGNISCRIPGSNQFYITGSATGGVPLLSAKHISKVLRFDTATNQLWCEGGIVASSESMSHGVIYAQCPEVMAVAHGHDLMLWQQLLYEVPTTDKHCAYGTPEMAVEIVHLLKTPALQKQKLFVMAGHEEGLFSFGESLEEATQLMVELIK